MRMWHAPAAAFILNFNIFQSCTQVFQKNLLILLSSIEMVYFSVSGMPNTLHRFVYVFPGKLNLHISLTFQVDPED